MAGTNLEQHLAKPVHIQRLERSLCLEPFLDQVQEVLRRYKNFFIQKNLFYGKFLIFPEMMMIHLTASMILL